MYCLQDYSMFCGNSYMILPTIKFVQITTFLLLRFIQILYQLKSRFIIMYKYLIVEAYFLVVFSEVLMVVSSVSFHATVSNHIVMFSLV